MDSETIARIFWSGGSQAVRLPKAMRLPGSVVRVRRRRQTLVLEPLPEADDWTDLWERLVPLKVRRWPTRRAETRRPL